MSEITWEHRPTEQTRYMIIKMVESGVPHDKIARIMAIGQDTLYKHYRHELEHALDVKITKLAGKATDMALAGNEKMLTLLLKTQGAKYGFIERQVIEIGKSDELEQLQNKVKELEQLHDKDY